MPTGRPATTDALAWRRAAALQLLLPLILSLDACRPRPTSAADALDLDALTATVRIVVTSADGSRRARGVLGASRDGALRLELHDPVGRTRMTLVATGEGGAIAFDDAFLETSTGDALLASVLGEGIRLGDVLEAIFDGRSRIPGLEVQGRPAETLAVDTGEGTRIEVTVGGVEPKVAAEAFALPLQGNRRRILPAEARGLWQRL